MKRFVFISSPYTVGDPVKNVELQQEVFHILRDAGYIPIVPLLSHYLHLHRKRSYEDWIDYDFSLISTCDSLIRIRPIVNGKEIPSKGADLEEKEAKRLGLHYMEFNSVEQLYEFLNND